MEVLACAIIVSFKIREDLFIQLNRDSSILKISIFQYDYLKGIDQRHYGRLKMEGNA